MSHSSHLTSKLLLASCLRLPGKSGLGHVSPKEHFLIVPVQISRSTLGVALVPVHFVRGAYAGAHLIVIIVASTNQKSPSKLCVRRIQTNTWWLYEPIPEPKGLTQW